jgi:hypothetical protein
MSHILPLNSIAIILIHILYSLLQLITLHSRSRYCASVYLHCATNLLPSCFLVLTLKYQIHILLADVFTVRPSGCVDLAP